MSAESPTTIVQSELRGAVALITVNRPHALNALDRATLDALLLRIQHVRDDQSVGALVVTGAGRAFVAGADIAEMRGFSAVEGEAFSRHGHAVCDALEALPIVTIAAVNGYALGGGCELALACDWIYVSSQAHFGQPEVKLGIQPGFGGLARLTRRVGIAWARELVLTGETLSANEALRIGLANRIFEPDELLDASLAAAEAVAQRGPLAISAAKRALLEGQDADSRSAHALEQQAFGLAFATEDRLEGMNAFLEKREPHFKQR